MKSRIIVDTNLWISFLITSRFIQLDKLILNQNIQLLFSDELINEIIEVCSRPKFREIFSQSDILMMIDLIRSYGEQIQVTSSVELATDPSDNFLLALAKDGKADYLITGDQALIALENVSQTKIISYSDFVKDMYFEE